MVAEHLVSAGVWDCRIGIADGMFAAEQAARRAAPQDCCVVRAGRLGAVPGRVLPVSALDDAELVGLLRRLGHSQPGRLRGPGARDVLTRFGAKGAWLHRLARGLDHRPAVSRRPPLELDQRVAFEPRLETIEPIVFSTRQTADRCVAELARHGLVCTELRIEVVADGGWTGCPGLGALPLVRRRGPGRPALLAVAGRPGSRAGLRGAAGARGGGVAGRSR